MKIINNNKEKEFGDFSYPLPLSSFPPSTLLALGYGVGFHPPLSFALLFIVEYNREEEDDRSVGVGPIRSEVMWGALADPNKYLI